MCGYWSHLQVDQFPCVLVLVHTFVNLPRSPNPNLKVNVVYIVRSADKVERFKG